MESKRLLHLGFIALSLFCAMCAKNSLSDRDVRRNQLTNSAEIKRRELMLVAGHYRGVLTQTNGPKHSVQLNLEIKDVPMAVEDQVDPIMTPILTGYFRFYFAAQGAPGEYLGFDIQKADFDSTRNKLDLVQSHSEYKDLNISMDRNETGLSGKWTSQYMASSGDIELQRSEEGPPELSGSFFTVLRGTHQGSIKNTNPASNLPERIMLSFVTKQELNNITVSGSLRLYLGPFGSVEYVEMPFSEIEHNFITRKIVAKTSGEYKLTLKADVNTNDIQGKLFSDGLGELADVELDTQ